VLLVGASTGAAKAEAPVRIQEVLCAASGSAHSPRTLDYAECLAARAGAHLTLLHVTEPGSMRVPPVPPWTARIQPRPGQVDACVSCGSPRSEILRHAQERGADVIVIGAHDRGPGLTDYLGSTAGHVVREAGRAVLTVKATPSPARTERSSGEAPAADLAALPNRQHGT
jgi:nucleotide-binding universal stress UspA family protein